MRKALFLILFFAAWATMSSAASAGVVSALASQNTFDDNLTDDSLGFVVDANSDGTVSVGDVAFGIAWLDDINGDPSIAGSAYIVYSVEFLTLSASTGAATYKPTTVAAYKLDALLGVDINDNSVAAIVERTGAAAGSDPFYPKLDGDYGFGNGTFASTTVAGLIDDINGADADGLMAGASFVFAVGIDPAVGSADFFATGPLTYNSGIAKWQAGLSAGLSVTDPGVLTALDFKALTTNPLYESVVTSATQTFQGGTALAPPDFSAVGGSIKTYDAGNYLVNYVPEPTSLMGLLGIGLAGSVMKMVRRRRKN